MLTEIRHPLFSFHSPIKREYLSSLINEPQKALKRVGPLDCHGMPDVSPWTYSRVCPQAGWINNKSIDHLSFILEVNKPIFFTFGLCLNLNTHDY